MLKEMLPALLADQEELAKKIEWKKIGGGQFLTMQATGAEIPWDELEFEEVEESAREMLEKIKPIMEKKTVAVALGVKGDYMLLSIGDSNEHLSKLGEGKLLIDRPELARLREHAKQKVVSTSYASQQLAKSSYNLKQYVGDLAVLFDAMLYSPDFELDDMIRASMSRDIKEFAKDLGEFIPEPGGSVGFSYMTDRGYEGFQQNWTENLYLDGSSKLSVLNHVGDDPLLVVANRAKYRPDDYKMLVKWIKKGHS